MKGHFFTVDGPGGKKFSNSVEQAYVELSKDAYHQVVEDCLFANHPKQANYLAPSIMPLRKIFDPNYYKITSQFAGGYPRPHIEIAESLWDFSESAKYI